VKVQTSLGLVDRACLTVKDVIEESDMARVVASEWYFGGELVRRDVWVNGLRPLEIGVKEGT
jgi:hypothetical protein